MGSPVERTHEKTTRVGAPGGERMNPPAFSYILMSMNRRKNSMLAPFVYDGEACYKET